MIIGDPNISDLNEKIIDLENKLNRQINPSIYTVDEFKSKKEKGIGFFEDVLKKTIVMLIGNKNEL